MPLFTYELNIPDGPHNPSNDQPLMELNNNIIPDLIAVDHMTFNVNNGGQHKAVHFNQDASYVPVPLDYPITTPLLVTATDLGAGNNLPGSRPQLFYYSGDASESAAQYAITDSGGLFNPIGPFGSTIVTCGFIYKWGVKAFAPIATHQTGSINFSSAGAAFPTNCFNVIVSLIANNAGTLGQGTISVLNGPSKTAFTWVFNGVPTDYSGFYWWAVGN